MTGVWTRCAVRNSRFGIGLGAEGTGVRQARRPLWRRGRGVSRGVRPSGGRGFCASHRISPGKGTKAKNPTPKYKTSKKPQAASRAHPDLSEYIVWAREKERRET